MRPRVFRYAIFILTALAVMAGFIYLKRSHRQPSRPNIVLIVVDTLRADHLPLYGYPKNTAPFLKSLAGKMVVFQNAFSTSSWTIPATASILTSLYPFQHNAYHNMFYQRDMTKKFEGSKLNRIPLSLDTLPEILKQHGYQTFCAADNVNIYEEAGFNQGFDHFIRLLDKGADRISEIIKSWHDQITSGQPYFLYIHYNDPHEPYQKHAPWYQAETEPIKDNQAAYDSEIRLVDENIRELYELFGWDQNTLFILTADHGEEFMEHGQTGHGKSVYQEVIHVPLLMSWPERFRGDRVVTRQVSAMDILPTILDLMGVSVQRPLSGISLKPILEKRPVFLKQRYFVSCLYDFDPRKAMTQFGRKESIIAGRFKYINDMGRKMFFDILNDPGETNNIVNRYPETFRFLAYKLRELKETSLKYPREFSVFSPDAETIENLKSLGYAQ